jgi:hypothetical protein
MTINTSYPDSSSTKQSTLEHYSKIILVGMFGISLLLTGIPLFPAKALELGSSEVKQDLVETIINHENKELSFELKTQLIASYFESKKSPGEKYAKQFIESAEANGHDWRLLAAIGMVESGAFKFPCKTKINGMGWGGCSIGFNSYEEAIETVAKNLAGKNPSTAHYYNDAELDEKLYRYNSVNPKYNALIKKVMNDIFDPTETETA